MAIEPRLEELIRKYGASHPELRRVSSAFQKFSRELIMHLAKEENTLFPYITKLEEAVEHQDPFPRPSYGTVANPIRMMMMEHDSSRSDFEAIRQASRNYEGPLKEGPDFARLYQALKELEQDLEVHSNLEDLILFPRAVALEKQASRAQGAQDSERR